MGFLGRLFNGSGDDEAAGGHSGGTFDDDVQCEVCACFVAPDAVDDEGQCLDCDGEYSGTKYCCGQIYEEDEDVCASCGEPL